MEMEMINQKFEDDNNHGSGGSTNSIDAVARVNVSEEVEMVRVIRLYLEIMRPVIRANQFDDDKNHGSGGSTSSIDEFARVSASTEAEMEPLISLCKKTLWPMISSDINTIQQKFLSVMKEKLGLDLSTGRTRNFGNRSSASESPVLQFQFLNGISTQVSTGMNIEGKDHKPFMVALLDRRSRQIVTTGAEAATEVEIVVLEGDCNDYEAENWSCDEFNNKIVREWNGKKVLQGNTLLKLNKGIVSVNKISFTHNSDWKGKRNCRLGVRSKDPVFATMVKEAKTESFLVKDKRTQRYCKHATPLLSDPVYRLHEISHGSSLFNRLNEANIKTVMDLRTLDAINPKRLKDMLKVHPNKWKKIMNHAQMCKDDMGLYLYHHPRDDQKKDGVVFNIYGQLVGLVADSQFLPGDKLPSHKKADAQKLIVYASYHWEEVVESFNNEASLINHLQSGTRCINGLNVVIPYTNNETSVSTQISPKYDIIGAMPTGQSQSPKRPASEHAISNSPKKPRDDDAEDEDYKKYLNLSETQKWKRVWCVTAWISVFLESRKKLQTLFVIAASIEHAQI